MFALCNERVEVLELEKRGIRVAAYLTELPPRQVLEQKLHDAVRLARARLTEGKKPRTLCRSSRGS